MSWRSRFKSAGVIADYLNTCSKVVAAACHDICQSFIVPAAKKKGRKGEL